MCVMCLFLPIEGVPLVIHPTSACSACLACPASRTSKILATCYLNIFQILEYSPIFSEPSFCLPVGRTCENFLPDFSLFLPRRKLLFCIFFAKAEHSCDFHRRCQAVLLQVFWYVRRIRHNLF